MVQNVFKREDEHLRRRQPRLEHGWMHFHFPLSSERGEQGASGNRRAQPAHGYPGTKKRPNHDGPN